MSNTSKSIESARVLQGFYNDFTRQISITRSRISSPRLSVIQHLIEQGPQTLKSLAAHRRVSAASMSRLVASLVLEGWVLRANSRKDKRSKIFMVTLKGKNLSVNESDNEIKKFQAVINNLSQQEQINLSQSVLLVKKVIGLASHPSHEE